MISNERPFERYLMWQYLEENYMFSFSQWQRNKVHI